MRTAETVKWNNDMTFEFSYITKLGEVDRVKMQIHGKAFYSMLASSNLKKRPIFLYDKSPYKNNGERIIYETESMINSWSSSQNQLLTQNSNISYGNSNWLSLSQVFEWMSMSKVSEYTEITYYQDPSTFCHQHNTMTDNNTVWTNMI